MPAYVEFREIPGTTGSVDASFNRTYTRTFQVVVDDPTVGPFFAGSHPSLPLIYSPHNEDPFAFCVGLVPTRSEEDPQVWTITATYAYNVDAPVALAGGGGVASPGGSTKTGNPAVDSQQQGYAPGDRVTNPLSRPKDYSYSTVKISTIPVDEEPYIAPGKVSIRKIRNTAGDPFQDQPSRDVMALQITIGLNSLVTPDQAWVNRLQTLNSNSVVIDGVTYGARELRLENISAQRVYEQVSYYRWTLNVTFRPHWRVELRNTGNRAWMELKDANGAATGFYGIMAPQDPKIVLPMDLDLYGRYLPPTLNAAGEVVPPTPTYTEFTVFPETSWPTPL
jgi:hypothetical protein